jgi:YgiT-type zinc finger domain-containing protein
MAASFFAVTFGKVTVEHAEGGRLIYPDQVPAAVCARCS